MSTNESTYSIPSDTGSLSPKVRFELENNLDLISTDTAACLLNIKTGTLRLSRVRGLLGGRSAPKYLKIGRKVVYERAEIDRWINQLKRFGNTGEEKAASCEI